MDIPPLSTHICAVPWSHSASATTARGLFQPLPSNHPTSSLFFISFPILMVCQQRAPRSCTWLSLTLLWLTNELLFT